MNRFAVLAALIAAAGCTPAQVASTEGAVTTFAAKGQLYCKQATIAGPLVVAVATVAHVPLIATNATADAVRDACLSIDAIPVSPPANPSSAPTVASPTVTAALPLAQPGT